MSTRILFYRPPSEFTPTNGEIVRRLQLRLDAAGFDPKGFDGIYGGNTVAALKGWQQKVGHTPTGEVSVDTWMQLMGSNIPIAKNRALQLTAAFEGTGFTKVVGNFDGAWLTWGIVGFTLSNGELDRILTNIDSQLPQVFQDAFGPLTAKMRAVLKASPSDQRDWANSISIPPSKYRVVKEWADSFDRLGQNTDVQQIQLAETERYWKIAVKQFEDFQLQTEVGLSLMFDIAVQNGGLESNEAVQAHKLIQDQKPDTEREVCAIIGRVVADNSGFPADVRSRKLAIARGSGTVHGDRYLVDAWGIDDFNL